MAAGVNARVLRREEAFQQTPVTRRESVATSFLRAVESGQLEADVPTSVILADKIVSNVRQFDKFGKGAKHMYATKANPSPEVMKILFEAGITHFDVASGKEIASTRKLLGPSATLYFMNPIKSDTDIDLAFEYDVKGFVADSHKSLDKIVIHPDFDPAHHAVVIRVALPKSEGAAVDLSGKFGAKPERAVELLQRCQQMGVADIGMSFHVGSENHDHSSYARAIDIVGACARQANVTLNTVDVGGGFPSFTTYAHFETPAPDFRFYVAQINSALKRNNLLDAQLLTEPGRSLVADAGVLVSRALMVDEDRNAVYLNTGTFGGLYDAGEAVGFGYATSAFNTNGQVEGPIRDMTVFGPTCDSADVMAREWALPAALNDGDYLAIENLGAYGLEAMSSDFNGFGQYQTLVLKHSG